MPILDFRFVILDLSGQQPVFEFCQKRLTKPENIGINIFEEFMRSLMRIIIITNNNRMGIVINNPPSFKNIKIFMT